jgi:hypothetical protein
MRMLLGAGHKFVAAVGDGDELYARAADRHERRNLVDSPEHAGLVREMRSRLAAHIEASDPSPQGRDLLGALQQSLSRG